MTTEQKFLAFINQVNEYLKAEELAEKTNSSLHIGAVRSLKQKLKVEIATHRLTPVQKSTVVKSKKPNSFNYNQSWLGQ